MRVSHPRDKFEHERAFQRLFRGACQKQIVKHGFRALLPGRLVSHAVPTTDGVPHSGLCRGRAVQDKAVGRHCSTPNARKLASCSSSGVSGLPCLRTSILSRMLARIFAHQSVPSSHRSSNVNAFSGKASRFTAGVRFRDSSTCRITSAGTGKNRRTACVRRIPSRNSASLTSANTSPQVLTSNSNSACAGLGCR